MKIVALIVCAAALSGCALGGTWTKPGATAEQFEQDKADCLNRAQAATANNPNGDALLFAGIPMMQSCMRSKGYIHQS